MKHIFPIIYDGKPADFCSACNAFVKAQAFDPLCLGSYEARIAAREAAEAAGKQKPPTLETKIEDMLSAIRLMRFEHPQASKDQIFVYAIRHLKGRCNPKELLSLVHVEMGR